MKAKVKATGEIIDVHNLPSYPNVWFGAEEPYDTSELNFNFGNDEEAVIEGWICRDRELDKEIYNSDLFLCHHKPKRNEVLGSWEECGEYILIPTEMFPSVTWDSEPLEVTITIKQKNKS